MFCGQAALQENLFGVGESFKTIGMHLARNFFAGLIVASGLVFLAGCSHERHQTAPSVATPALSAPVTAPAVTNRVEPVPQPSPLSSSDSVAPGILSWDGKTKKYNAQPGELIVPFTFALTNVSTESLMVYATETTCGCTVAKLPSNPWVLAPGAGGEIAVTMDIKGKVGVVSKDIVVFTSKGNAKLSVEVTVPPAPSPEPAAH
jgi:hypothetical protein